MIELDGKNGWCWHFKMFNYLTKEVIAYNSQKPFPSSELAFKDMLKFMKGLKVKSEEKDKTSKS